MDESQAKAAFAALSQETRLRIVRLLVKAGPGGVAAGSIAESVEGANSTVSFHLKELERAGLVVTRREARSIIYAVDFGAMTGLIQFLMEDCCSGHPEICTPVFTQGCCVPSAEGLAS